MTDATLATNKRVAEMTEAEFDAALKAKGWLGLPSRRLPPAMRLDEAAFQRGLNSRAWRLTDRFADAKKASLED